MPPAVKSPTCGISWNNNLGLGKKKKGGKQAEHNSVRRWLPSFNSKMTQRFSGPSVAFPRLRREPAPAGLDHRTRCDAYWLTHRRQGTEPDGKDTNRSDTSQQSGFCQNVSAGRRRNNEVVSFVWKLAFSLIALVVFYLWYCRFKSQRWDNRSGLKGPILYPFSDFTLISSDHWSLLLSFLLRVL